MLLPRMLSVVRLSKFMGMIKKERRAFSLHVYTPPKPATFVFIKDKRMKRKERYCYHIVFKFRHRC